MVAAPKGVLRDAAGRVLLVRRSLRSTYWPGLWELPGGKPDDGETLDTAVEREVFEETAMRVTARRFLAAVAHDLPHRRLIFIAIELLAQTGPAQVKLSNEHDDFRWIDAEDLTELTMAPVQRQLLKDALAAADGRADEALT